MILLRARRSREPHQGGPVGPVWHACLCQKFFANQLRLLFAALAYTLMERLRALALSGTELERACAATIRIRLLKIGAAIVRNTRRIRLLLASHHPLRDTHGVAERENRSDSCPGCGRKPSQM